MRARVARSAVAVLLTWASCAAAQHVALISIDGLRPVDLLGTGGCAAPATLSSMARAGVHAEGVIGVLPTVTYPSHATLVTGAYPTKHGVLNNQRARDGAPWHYDRADIRVPTLWDAARGKGLSVAIVTWPSTYNAQVDYLIPEDLSNGSDVAARIEAGSTPGLFASLASAHKPALLPFGDHDAGTPLDAMTAAFASQAVRRHKPNLLLLHFLDLDHREHYQGIGSAGACASLQAIDRHVAALRQAYADAGILERTTFFIVSDHGFAPLHTAIGLRELLKPAGWGDAEIRTAGGSAAVYAAGDAKRAPLAEVRARIDARFRGTVRWLSEEDAARSGGFPGAAFVLCAAPGYSLSAGESSPLLARNQVFRATHGYCPDEPAMLATFAASGPGVRALGSIPVIRMVDIAPTIAALLGVELADADGNPILGILAPAQK